MTHRLAVIRTCKECPHVEPELGPLLSFCMLADRDFRYGTPGRIPSWCPLPKASDWKTKRIRPRSEERE